MALGKVTSRITFESVIDPFQGEFIKIRMDDEVKNFHVERILESSSEFSRDNLELAMKKCLTNMVVELEKYHTIHNILFNQLKRWCNKDMSKDATNRIYGTKTIVRCSSNEEYDPEKGLAIAFMKRALGDGNKHNKILRKETQKKIELIDEMHEHHHTTPKDVAATVGAIAKEMDDKLRETFGKKKSKEDENVTATGAE